jgi:hypothetical protein
VKIKARHFDLSEHTPVWVNLDASGEVAPRLGIESAAHRRTPAAAVTRSLAGI